MSGYAIQQIHWETTPQELRAIADEMEKKLTNLPVGGRTDIKTVTIVYPIENQFAIDLIIEVNQKNMRK